MKKILAFVILCGVIVVGGKFHLEYRYKKELDQSLRGASLFADIVYKDLNVSFGGEIELLGLRITPNVGFSTFSARSIKISGFDLLFHFNAKSRIKKGEFPNSLRYDIDQFSFPASIYEEFAMQDKKDCQSLQGTLLYSSAGFDQVILNASIELDLSDPFAASVNFEGSDQISKSSFSMNFNARELGPSTLASGIVPVESARYDFSLDEEAASAMLDHCAKKFKVTPDVFLEKVVKSEKFMGNSFGFDLGEKARSATADFFEGGKEIVIRSIPSDRLKNLNFASKLSSTQIINMLNLNVSLDGSTVPIRSLASGFQSGSIVDEESDAETEGFKRRSLEELMYAPDGTVQERVKPTLTKKRKNDYESASLNQATDYIYRDVKISRTKDRSPVKGVLLSAKDKVLLIEMYRYGGVMTYTVPYDDITAIEIKKR